MMSFYRDLRARMKALGPPPVPAMPEPEPTPEPKPEPEPELPPPPPPPPPLLPLTPVGRIVLAVAHEFDMPMEMICSRTCVQSVVVPRHVVVFLATQLTNASHYQIGKAIGHRDHSSIGNSIASLKGKMASNPALAFRIERLRHTLLEMGGQHDKRCEQDSDRARDCGSCGPDVVAPGAIIGGEGNGSGIV